MTGDQIGDVQFTTLIVSLCVIVCYRNVVISLSLIVSVYYWYYSCGNPQ